MGLISNGSTIFDAGSMASGFGGSMVFIKKLTASSSATLSFVDGSDGVVLDDTYKEYVFTFNNIHPATDGAFFTFNGSIDSGSNYNVAKTTTYFRANHKEDGSGGTLGYRTGDDLAQSTDFQKVDRGGTNLNDSCSAGYLHLFNPSSTTFVKHFIAETNVMNDSGGPGVPHGFMAGYANTTSAVDAIRFQMDSGNIDAGDICLYGIA